MTTEITYTNSCLSAARSCLRKYELRYELLLEMDREEEREPLAVGTCWHGMHDAAATGGEDLNAPYTYATDHAPSELWAEKLRRLFAAQEWYWKDQPLQIVEPEKRFRVKIGGITFEGKVDGILTDDAGRRGLLERKTTADAVDAESDYWKRLRMDVQVGIYGLAFERPAFIVYDVVRKPGIKLKKLTKADRERMAKECEDPTRETVKYYGEHEKTPSLKTAIAIGTESHELYGARLTSDIGNRPEYYFARREVSRTAQDYNTLIGDLVHQVRHLESATDCYRNPDACQTYGTCEFFGLCSNNIHPRAGYKPPQGFRVREHRHPELAD